MKSAFSTLWQLHWKTYKILPNIDTTYVNVGGTYVKTADTAILTYYNVVSNYIVVGVATFCRL